MGESSITGKYFKEVSNKTLHTLPLVDAKMLFECLQNVATDLLFLPFYLDNEMNEKNVDVFLLS